MSAENDDDHPFFTAFWAKSVIKCQANKSGHIRLESTKKFKLKPGRTYKLFAVCEPPHNVNATELESMVKEILKGMGVKSDG